MKKILIFKNDMLGDFLQLSRCIKEIHENYNDHKITLICSKNNYQIAKNFSFIDKFIILNHKSFIITLFSNLKDLLLTEYEHVFVFDGKNSSFRTSYFVRGKTKSCLCFVKKKNFLFINFRLFRPFKFFLYLFYKNYIFCDEDYSNTKIKYQELYFQLLKNLNLTITSKKNYFILNNDCHDIYSNFFNKYINDTYIIFHFDEKWQKYSDTDFTNSLKIIKHQSQKNKVLLTTGIKPFRFLNELEKIFSSFDYINKEIKRNNTVDLNNVMILKNLPLDLLAHFIANSSKNITSHSGPIINISSAFDVKIVDIIKKSKFNELGRWIPIESNYKRYSFEEIEKNINNI